MPRGGAHGEMDQERVTHTRARRRSVVVRGGRRIGGLVARPKDARAKRHRRDDDCHQQTNDETHGYTPWATDSCWTLSKDTPYNTPQPGAALDKKKFLFVSLDGLIADIAWQVVKEGHEVKLFIEAKDEREIADGFVD